MFIGYVKYTCGIFKIASYRIERAMTINNLQKKFEKEITIYRDIIYAVNVHHKAMELCKSLISCFEGSFFSLIVIGVLNLSLNLCRIFQTISVVNDKEEIILHFIIVIITLSYMFLANYAGQEITDHNDHIFFTAYNVRWYIAPIHIQKMILFLLQIGNKAFGMQIGGLFVASINCFASLVSASISYFTVLYSTRQ
ncbi:PREDICTED: putative odorant receptor 92a [Acromyrmex echinatior]|uniref:putative odorant receptor 92a n=1 Tax=Acromyrmex echinatior TaxID=103372 RepID=UPI00058101A1|nr:PREDICTED: putative odorant receptor 92a [Acromyrmex echinatior]